MKSGTLSIDDFHHLMGQDPLLYALVRRAVDLHEEDPGAALLKLRKYGEFLSRRVAQHLRIDVGAFETHIDLLNAIAQAERSFSEQVDRLHRLRKAGNRAAHEEDGVSSEDARRALHDAHALAHWYLAVLGIEGDEPRQPPIDQTQPTRRPTQERDPQDAPRELVAVLVPGASAPEATLYSLADRACRLLEALRADAAAVRAVLEEGRERIEFAKQPFRLGVVGEFRAGKSTLVNALTGSELALTGEVETTHVISRYAYGPRPRALLVWVDREPEEMSLSEANAELLRRRQDHEWARAIDHVLFEAPSEVLKRFDLWDAPGLGGSERNEELANRYIEMIGGALWVFDSGLLGDHGLVEPLQRLREAGKKTLGLINRADELADDEREQAVNYVRDTFGPLLTDVSAVSALEMSGGDEKARSDLLGRIEQALLRSAEADRQGRIDAAIGRTASAVSRTAAKEFHGFKDELGLIAHLRDNLATAREHTLRDLDELIGSACDAVLDPYEAEARRRVKALFMKHDNSPARRGVEGVLDELNKLCDLTREWPRVVGAVMGSVEDRWSTFSSEAISLARATAPSLRFAVGATPRLEQSAARVANDAAESAAWAWGGASVAALGIVAAASAAITWPIVLAALPIGLLAGSERSKSILRERTPSLQDALDLVSAIIADKRTSLVGAAQAELPENLALTLDDQLREILERTINDTLGTSDLQGLQRTLADLQETISSLWMIAAETQAFSDGALDPLAAGDLELPSGATAEGMLAAALSSLRGGLDVISPSADTRLERILVHLPSGLDVRWVTTADAAERESAAEAMKRTVDGWPGRMALRITVGSDGHRVPVDEVLLISAGRAWTCAHGTIGKIGKAAVTLKSYPLGQRAAEQRFAELWTGLSSRGKLRVHRA